MKNLVAIMLGVFSYLSASGSELKHEASMNFDLENIASFLTELDAKFELGIDAVKLEEFVTSVPIGDERSIVVDILDSRRKTKMEFRIFMDDVDAMDLYMFFDSRKLSESIGDFMISWAEAVGM